MSRLTKGSVFKAILAVLFFPFIVFLVLLIGIGAKNKKVIVEGAIYVALFITAFSTPEGSALYSAASIIGLGAIAVAAVRSYMLRDLWLHRKGQGREHGSVVQPGVPVQAAPLQSEPAPISAPALDLSSSLGWVTSIAKRNKHRLPTQAYVTILETCQTLDAVIDAERQRPSADAQFEYELDAIVRQYLPTVLQGYLAIPPGMVDDRQPNGRTPNEELTEQLQLLSGQADALHSSRHGHTSAELSSTGNFLRERFGHQQSKFDFGIE